MKTRLTIALVFLIGAGALVQSYRMRADHRRRHVAALEDLATARQAMKAAFDQRTDFIAEKYPLIPARAAGWKKSLHSLRDLAFVDQKDFDLYDRTQSRLASDLAGELARLRPRTGKAPHLDGWIKTLQAFDRRSDDARSAYVQAAVRARAFEAGVPSFRTEDLAVR